MGGTSPWHWIVVGIVILLFFGKGRFSGMMGDVAEGIKSFKKGMSDEVEKPAPRIEDAQKSVESDKQADKTA